ncbi:hypothetical protein QP970_09750 [Corynebacterium sp. MSK073]|uniref:hypothetical protein n=1 Tax=Corynebacterium sp. MSK073 TaxID=3050198 RepID=UPI0025505870|nr:hypothetical protein [Corynebacterium sp. MSK073]MDK8815634.1 hypothetical protein [Corynebacterium sp. MSK073]
MEKHVGNSRRLVNGSREVTLLHIRQFCYPYRAVTQEDIASDLHISRAQLINRLRSGFTAGEVIELAEVTESDPVSHLVSFGFITEEQVSGYAKRKRTPEQGVDIRLADAYASKITTAAVKLSNVLRGLDPDADHFDEPF